MPIAVSDIQFFKSINGIGGTKTANELTSGLLNDLFDQVSSDEALAGKLSYRCFYVENQHATLTLSGAGLYITSQTTSTSTSIAGGRGLNNAGIEEAELANELIDPGAVFLDTVDQIIALPDIPPASFVGIWLRRNVSANASAADADTSTFEIRGDTTE